MLNTLRPPALPLDALHAFAERSYGLSGVWSPLEGERDQNYRVLGAGGVSATFKVCHPAEGDAILQCQATALEHIAEADPALPVPRLIRTRNGEPLARITHDGQHYPVMVLSWLEGHVLGGDTLGRDGLFDLGKLLARLGVALRGFVNGAPAERDLVWDTRHVLRLASEIGSYLPLPRTRADREQTGDSRKSIAERFASREDYLGRIALAAVALVDEGFLLGEDVPAVTQRAATHYDWARR